MTTEKNIADLQYLIGYKGDKPLLIIPARYSEGDIKAWLEECFTHGVEYISFGVYAKESHNETE